MRVAWQPLKDFHDASVPKLNNLRRAAVAGIRVPATCWARAADISDGHAFEGPPRELGSGPWIIRSGSPTEDTHATSNAGQLLSLPVHEAAAFGEALRRVVEALPSDAQGRKLGAVFVQPFVKAREAGVAFFDGFYFERTQSRESNESLTSGQARGEVQRGHLTRGDEWSKWLQQVYAVFCKDQRIDIEFARDNTGYVLLQCRPALFPIQRNPLLSLSNHKEILGDAPTPWIVTALVEAGKDLSFMAQADYVIKQWNETYAIEAAERAWMNFSFWFRWMDHFGMPRTTVTKNFGGDVEHPEDARIIPHRFFPLMPAMFRFQFLCWREVPGLPREFRRLDHMIERAKSLHDYHQAMVQGLALALRANFALNAALAGILKVRQFLRIPGKARVVTQEMMEDYHRLAELPPKQRDAGLDAWLHRYGHRGPLESDPIHPRFAELREVLRADLETVSNPSFSANSSPSPPASGGEGWGEGSGSATIVGRSTPSPPAPLPRSRGEGRRQWWEPFTRPFYWLDERREWFRDSLMRRWQILRQKILAEAKRLHAMEHIDTLEDVFWLRGDDLLRGSGFREASRANRARWEAARHIDLPLTATREAVEQLLSQASLRRAEAEGKRVFAGIPLSSLAVEGIARKADNLMTLLTESTQPGMALSAETILVVPTLEPSWAVVFPRVGGVVTETGGELSHASILLREARKPAVVNCTGIWRNVQTGQRLSLDGSKGMVEIING
ncbi:MAG TPA: PEP-utilizing enzyme [Gemmataceae bacterium]|nr:PEP-utilizing enzyme [Gemmataceae bacterium]